MTRDKFKQFVADELEDVIGLAEERSGISLSRNIAFQWLGRKSEPLRVGILDAIVDRVYVSEDAIYPCVDLGVGDLLDDGTPLVVANVAGYPPKPFGENWTGRPGPFVRIIGGRFMSKVNGQLDGNADNADSLAFGFSIPDMQDSN
jgi:hypothetical protein